jgi:hypothetical protein
VTARVVGARSNGLVGVELYAKRFRACRCGTPNPDFVECPSCGVMNYSGHPCRNCLGPGGVPIGHWSTCPGCGAAAIVDDLGKLTAWYANPLKQLWQIFTEWRAKRASRKDGR